MFEHYQFFGYELKKNKQVEADRKGRDSVTTPTYSDGAYVIDNDSAAYGHFGSSVVDFGQMFKTEQDLINKYREISEIPEVDTAIDDITNEAIVIEDNESPVDIDLSDVDLSDKIKEEITEEFEYLTKIMGLRTRGHDIFREWYVDGKKYFEKVIDLKSPKKGIRELRPIDPMKMRKIREVKKEKKDGVDIVTGTEEYYLYDAGSHGYMTENYIRLSPDSITYCPSGLMDKTKTFNVGYLYKSIKPANQLRMMEDSVVIYRLSRAPERRVFYVDVGNMQKPKAEQYIQTMARRYKNKLVYDANTGETRTDRNHLAMTEDFWLARREGQSTEVDTLAGAQNLGEIEDVQFFLKKLYKSLNVPISRLEPDSGFSLGRASEITRDELKFNRFIIRIRNRFSEMFYDILKTQLVLKMILKPEEWEAIKKDIKFSYRKDNHFSEMKDMEILGERLNTLSSIENYLPEGEKVFFTPEYVMEHVLQFNEEEIKALEKFKKENPPAEPDDDGFSGGFGR